MAEHEHETGTPAVHPGAEHPCEPDAGSPGRVRALELENAELKRCRTDLEALVAAQAAELRRAHAVARSAREAKRAFLSNLSHEVRTPLNVIQGMAHLLGASIDDPGVQDRLAMIREAGQRLLRLFEDLIDLARGESDDLGTPETEFDPGALFEAFGRAAADRIEARGLGFSADWGWLPPRLTGDPERLRQVLGIYLDNALKFTDRGAIRLSADLLEESPREVLIRCAVSDTGSGVPADLVPRLFEAFEQADVSTTRRHGGVGVGLALARSLARRMGGDAGFAAVRGGGSTFWFTARLGVPPGEPGSDADLLSDLKRRAGAGRSR